MSTLKVRNSFIIIGGIVLAFGIIFHLQGNSVVGPESSFMYANPEWISYGLAIAVIGGLIICAGLGLAVLKKF